MKTWRAYLASILIAQERSGVMVLFIIVTTVAPSFALYLLGAALGYSAICPPGVHPLAPAVLLMVVGAAGTIALNVRLVHWLQRIQDETWRCRNCAYDLRGTVHARCPECGEVLS